MYYFYLDKVLLPVAPEKLTVKINNQNKTANLINEGMINFLKDAGLTDIDFEALIPAQKYPFAVYTNGFLQPEVFLNKLNELKTSKKPFQFIVSRVKPDGTRMFSTNMQVSMETYTIGENAKEGLDFTVKINLKQYVHFGTQEVEVDTINSTATVEPSRQQENSPAPAQTTTYTVVKGDCLWKIAKKFYGDGSKYTVIYNANKSIIGGNPDMIQIGMVLTIPSA